jgi:hypothetical protein
MTQYVGLDVSLKETKLHGRAPTTPNSFACFIKHRTQSVAEHVTGAKALLGALENQIRGILKTFGRIVPKGGGGLFEKNVRVLITEVAAIAAVIMPLLQARQVARGNCAALDRRLIRLVQGDPACRMLMTMPGIGPITAVAYAAALEKADNFKQSRAVGAWSAEPSGLLQKWVESITYEGMDMKPSRFTEEQIIRILREQEAGARRRPRCAANIPHSGDRRRLHTRMPRAGARYLTVRPAGRARARCPLLVDLVEIDL